MKYIKLSLVVMMALVFGIPMVHAQSITSSVRANVPFQFSVSGRTVDAGEYVVSTEQEKVLAIRNLDGQLVAMVLTTGLDDFRNHDTKLVFRRVADRYYLSQVWMNHLGSGREVRVPSKDKIKLARTNGDDQVAVVPAK